MNRSRAARWLGSLFAAAMSAGCGGGASDATKGAPAATPSATPTEIPSPLDAGSRLATDAAATAIAAPPTSAPLPPGAPVVLTGLHAPLGSAWLPNGHLMVATSSETLDIDPEHPDAPWAVRAPLQKDPPLAIVGNGGGDRFLVLDTSGVTIWDASNPAKVAPLQKIAPAQADRDTADRFDSLPLSISRDGTRIATVQTSEKAADAGVVTVFDAHTAAVVATLAPRDEQDYVPYQVALSDDGKLAVTTAIDHVWVVDVATGKTVVHRMLPRSSSRSSGPSIDTCVVRGGRILMSSANGLEVIDASSGKVLRRTQDGRAMGTLSVSVSPDGSRFFFDGQSWDAAHGGPVTRDPRAPRATGYDMWRFPPLTIERTDEHFSTRSTGEGLEIDDASGRAVARFGEVRARSFDGPRTLEIFDGVVRAVGMTTAEPVVTLAQMNKPPATLPRAYATARSQQTSHTHAFAMLYTKKAATVVAWDAKGHEVFRHVVAGMADAELKAADGFVAIVGAAGNLQRCDAEGCVAVAGTFPRVSSFLDPWMVADRTKRPARPVLVNVRTGEERPPPTGCKSDVTLVAPAPASICQLTDQTRSATGSSGARTIPFPPHFDSASAVSFAGELDGRWYFDLGRDDFGLERAFRYDPARNQATQLYIVDHAAIAQYDDGTVERFGDDAASAGALRCPTDAGWAAFTSCATKWDVRARLEDATR